VSFGANDLEQTRVLYFSSHVACENNLAKSVESGGLFGVGAQVGPPSLPFSPSVVVTNFDQLSVVGFGVRG